MNSFCFLWETVRRQARYHNVKKKSSLLWGRSCLKPQNFITVDWSWVNGTQKALIVFRWLSYRSLIWVSQCFKWHVRVVFSIFWSKVVIRKETISVLKHHSICALQIFKRLVLSIKFSKVSPKTLFVWEQIYPGLSICFVKQSGKFFLENLLLLLDRIKKYEGS